MKLKYLSSVVSPSDEIVLAGALCFSPNGRKLAVVTADRHVLLFDEKFRRRDKFATKPVDAKYGKNGYLIKCATFSPDSSKFAVGQTDNIVYVFRLGESWDEKKVICNKFAQSSAVISLTWPSESTLIIGLLDGKVRLASVSSNKCSTLYKGEAPVCALAQHPNRRSFLSGHEDGAIFLYSFNSRTHSRVCLHSCAPFALILSGVGGIMAGGTDRRLVSYTEQGGRILQQFDYSGPSEEENEAGKGGAGEKEFTVATLDSSGHNAVFGSFDRIRLMCWNQRRGAWEEGGLLRIHNLYTIAGLAWKADGSILCCSNMLGAVIAIDCAIRKTILRNRFELTFVSPSQAILRDLRAQNNNNDGEEGGKNGGGGEGRMPECILRSKRGAELGEVRILGREQRYAIVYTPSTLILADMWTGLSSEIVWQSGGNEKFYLDNESVAYIVNAGEINFVEYGRDELAGWIRTERANPYQISVRLRRTNLAKHKNAIGNEQNNFQFQNAEALEIRRVAYLLDARTISIVDMARNTQIAQIQHGNAVDWLELNERANKLLFRDVRAALHLYSLESGQTNHLIGHSSYVQWVPKSDVVVAQSNDQLCIWYNTDEHTDRVVQCQIQGEVEMVARDSTRTEVIVLENNSRVAYELDSTMIEFGTALDELDLGRAVLFLEQSEQRGMDVQAMWRKLASIALEHSQLMVAQRCFASLNDLVRVQFLQETLLRAERQFCAPMDEAAVAAHFEVRARLAMMAKQFKQAERIWLENSALSEAIEMWRRLGDWETAMELARAMNYPELDSLRTQYERYLHDTGQQEKAAKIKMREGDQWAALELFLNAAQPAQAVQLLLDNRPLLSQIMALKSSSAEGTEEEMGGGMLEGIFHELERHEMFDKAGELHEAMDQHDKAFELYCRGHLYGKAIQIARHNFPERVVQLEEQWADWLFAQGIYDVAIPHYLESGNTIRAIHSAIHAREWEKALQILEALEQPSEQTAPFFTQIAQHFELAGELDKAESLYVNGGKLAEAIEMYNKAGRWVDAYKLAAQLFGIDQSRELYTEKAAQLVEEKRFTDAEKLFIALGEPNQAIAMYKVTDRTEDMMRLMGQFHADEVQNAHKRLAEELEARGDLRAAEEQFLLAGNWAAAVDMYQQAEQWADAHRLAKAEGGERAQKQIVYLWAKSLGGDAAVKLLTRHDQLEEAISMAVTKSDFEFVFELCRLGASHRLQFVQQKYAEYLEDEGELDKAEEHYLKAGKAREAVLMHTHNQNWDAAERIAQEHCPEQLPELFVQRARFDLEQRDYAHAESFLLRANRPGIILAFYRESAMWPEALRIARDYLPDELQQCQSDYEDFQLRSGAKGAQSLVAQAKEWEKQNEYRRAVECYMRLGMDDAVAAQQQDQQLVAQSLAKAAEIIVKFLSDSEDGMALLVRIGQRQTELRQFLGAGETFLLANRPTESIQSLLDAHEWAKAKRVAEELAPEMEQTVEESYRQFLRTHGRIGELIDVDVVAAIDMLVQAGQWEKALQTARQQNHRPLLDKYLATYSTELLADGQHEQLLRILRKFGATPNPQLLPIYSSLVEKLLNERPNAETNNYEMLSILRDLLFEVIRQMGTLVGNETQLIISQQTIQLFDRHLHLAHFCALRKALELAAAQKNGQGGGEALQLRLNLIMPRYIEPLRPDKAFYEAGSACKLLGGPSHESMAFLLLNQYLDITDAIDEDDPNLVDNSLFEGTDIPTSYALPRDKYLTEAEHEEVKEWVLAISVGQNVEKVLRMDDRDSYEASTIDSHGNLYPVCVVSGFPVIDEGHELGNGRVAKRRAWAAFTALVKQLPTDELFDVQQFLTKWSIQ